MQFHMSSLKANNHEGPFSGYQLPYWQGSVEIRLHKVSPKNILHKIHISRSLLLNKRSSAEYKGTLSGYQLSSDQVTS
jgi:hypothetical protein